MSFGENLRTIRRERGLTQEQLAEMLEVSRQAVSKWEAGSGYPEADKLARLAKGLGVSLDLLMDTAPASGADPTPQPAPAVWSSITIPVFDGSRTVSCLFRALRPYRLPCKKRAALYSLRCRPGGGSRRAFRYSGLV